MHEAKKTLNVLLALLLVILPFPLVAQAPGTIEGTVCDEAGVPLPGVSVELSGAQLKAPLSTVTDASGRYRFTSLPPGSYELKATLSGFAPHASATFVLGTTGLRHDFAMKIGAVETEIIVAGEAPLVDTTKTSTGTNVGTGQSGYVGDGVSSTDRERHGRRISSKSPKTPAPLPAPVFSPLPILSTRPVPDMFFRNFGVNPTIETEEEPVSTFSVTVDRASYTLARSFLSRGLMPDADGVRVEDFVNAFDYSYEPPKDGSPFAVHAEAFPSPNRKGYHVLHLGVKGRTIAPGARKPATLVFCIDVSGSMSIENRLGLVKRALRLLVDQLDERDRVGIVVYGTDARVLLEPVNATAKTTLLGAIDQLQAEGSTNAQAGIREAYRMAARHLRPGEINRIVLCSDGVANNGITDADAIFAEIKGEADRGITITTVGFGMGNYNDVLMERLAHVGNGNYAYVDRLEEAHRIFVRELGGTLEVIAKDVKIQVEFDPEAVVRYRLLGFESRALAKEEFADDRVDAGEIGAGHAVTALYEVKMRRPTASIGSLRIRYKEPDGKRSRLIQKELLRASLLKTSVESASSPARLSFVAASFAEKLRGSYWVRNLSYSELLASCDALGDATRNRPDVAELRGLVAQAERLDRRVDRFEGVVPIGAMNFDRVPVLK
jgi:Ca-activated chloride channel homolog